ncbi:MAG: hypothetical protein KAS32_05225 [Candidatus Peribacteraceae bacterium]|nr:hypothetical protein [Candidatus Peribacteraceae bacterium]
MTDSNRPERRPCSNSDNCSVYGQFGHGDKLPQYMDGDNYYCSALLNALQANFKGNYICPKPDLLKIQA